jgi:hypothetical protein
MAKWPKGAKLLETMADAGEGGGLSSRQISRLLKDWCRKHADLDPNKTSVWIQAYSATDELADPTCSSDVLQEWLNPKALTDGPCYFALADELEGYPIKVMRLFRNRKEHMALFDLLDYAPWDESGGEDE